MGLTQACLSLSLCLSPVITHSLSTRPDRQTRPDQTPVYVCLACHGQGPDARLKTQDTRHQTPQETGRPCAVLSKYTTPTEHIAAELADGTLTRPDQTRPDQTDSFGSLDHGPLGSRGSALYTLVLSCMLIAADLLLRTLDCPKTA